MKFSFACVSAVLAPVVVTARFISVTNDLNKYKQEHPQQQPSPSTFSKVKASTTYKNLVDRVEVRYEPNKIHNIDDAVKDTNNTDSDDDNKGTTSSTPATDSTSTSGGKEECVPPVTVNKSSKLDAGNLPLSSCSSSKKQICISKNNSNSSKHVKKSTSSIVKKTGICTDINDVPIAYWDDSDPSASSNIPSSYWEDTISTTTTTTHTTTTTSIENYEPLYEEDTRYYDHHRNLQDSCDAECSLSRPDVSDSPLNFRDLIVKCLKQKGKKCPYKSTMNCWNTAGITNMDRAFYKKGTFNKPLKCWDTSSVTSMDEMFSYAEEFDQPIGDWNTSKVTSMEQMFYDAYYFNQSVDNWDVSQVSNAGSLL
jgi:surface protein